MLGMSLGSLLGQIGFGELYSRCFRRKKQIEYLKI